jgi:3-deoxy-7-phosphoheptulonate synthase
MLESNLVAGKQSLISGQPLTYGQSITDACIDWQETELALEKLRSAVQKQKCDSQEGQHHA